MDTIYVFTSEYVVVLEHGGLCDDDASSRRERHPSAFANTHRLAIRGNHEIR